MPQLNKPVLSYINQLGANRSAAQIQAQAKIKKNYTTVSQLHDQNSEEILSRDQKDIDKTIT